jgi:glycosyltransferase involved in cell wall biosynthesis
MNLRGLKRLLYQWLWFKLPCWKAARITTISDATQAVLTRLVGSFKGKTIVIDNCIPAFIEPTPKVFNSASPCILQIGTGPHKNLDRLIEAVAGLVCELKIVGNPSEKDRRELMERQIPHSIESDVTDARIKEIYHEVDILFFASRHEGFGLPILEAQAAGIPVITSDRYSMPWVAGVGGALIVEPESPEEIRRAVEAICRDTSRRHEMLLRGKINVERFKPPKVARAYIQLYESFGA